MTEHPIQPLGKDEHGVIRFKSNAIVCHLLDHGGIDLNEIARLDFDQNDSEQFAQLIGYSLSGFSDLSYVRDTTYQVAEKMADENISQEKATIEVLQTQLDNVRECLRDLIPTIFRIHPSNLIE